MTAVILFCITCSGVLCRLGYFHNVTHSCFHKKMKSFSDSSFRGTKESPKSTVIIKCSYIKCCSRNVMSLERKQLAQSKIVRFPCVLHSISKCFKLYRDFFAAQ